MSFGGSVQGMITTLKNNSSLVGRRKKYFELKESTKYLKKRTNFKKATPDQLKNIKEKIRKENLNNLFLNHIFIRIFFILLFYLLNLLF